MRNSLSLSLRSPSLVVFAKFSTFTVSFELLLEEGWEDAGLLEEGWKDAGLLEEGWEDAGLLNWEDECNGTDELYLTEVQSLGLYLEAHICCLEKTRVPSS